MSDYGDAYYDHHALVALERHLALYGLLSNETRFVGQRAAALCGLPWTDVGQLVEHEAGATITELFARVGLAELEQRRARALHRALDDRPFGIVTLPDDALLQGAELDRVRSGCTLVVLEHDQASLHARLLERVGAGGRWHFAEPPLGDADELLPYVRRRESVLAVANHRLPVRGRSPERLARDLAALLMAPQG